MKRLLTVATLGLISAPAWAHTGHETSGLLAGLVHPVYGGDHLLAMLAVGLWAGNLGRHAMWTGPATFLAAMLVGFVLALAGIALPAVEPGIAISVLTLGLIVAFAINVRPVHALPVIALFAIWHGYAHGVTVAGGMIAYMAGMLIATAALHLTGVAIGRYASCRAMAARQALGGAIAGAGALMLTGLI